MTIKLSNLYKKFGDTVVLDDVSLEIEPGDVIALIGASGAGKSTCLRSINYLEVPDSGHVDIDDLHLDFANINKDDILNLRRKTAMVFQQFNLFERRTALENVMEGLIQVKKIDKVTAAEQAAQELIKVGLSDRMAYYPKFLSGGQKQRVALARTLVMKPKILLLDEPLSALDGVIKETVKERIREIAVRYQLTTLIVTHDPEEAMTLSDRILLLSDGKVAQFTEPAEIIHNPANDFVTNFILNQLNIKRRNILSLFANGISQADPLN